MKYLPLFLTVGALLSIAHGQATAPVEINKDIVYASPGNIPQKLDLYVPTGLAKLPPLIIYIHGGGWEAGSKNNVPCLDLLKQGFAIASVEYRFSNVAIFPAQIFDCKAAVRWLRAHADPYHYNATKVAAMGESAGGHLTALLGTSANVPELEGDEGNAGVSSAVQAVVDNCGPTDFVSLSSQMTPEQRSIIDNPVTHLFGGSLWGDGVPDSRLALAKLASPVAHVTPQACPFFIVHGDHDNIVPLQQSVELNDALQKVGVSSHLEVIAGGGHVANSAAAIIAATKFLQDNLQTP